MKKYIKAYVEEKGWPSSEFFLEFDGDEEALWDEYFSEAEEEVFDELEIFAEPSGQGNFASMVLYDESSPGLINRAEPLTIDFNSWVDKELQLAAATNHQKGYKALFRDWMLELMNDAGWTRDQLMKRLIRSSSDDFIVKPYKEEVNEITLEFSTDADADSFCSANRIDSSDVWYDDKEGKWLLNCTQFLTYPVIQVTYDFDIWIALGAREDHEYVKSIEGYTTTALTSGELNSEMRRTENLSTRYYAKRDSIEVLDIVFDAQPSQITYK